MTIWLCCGESLLKLSTVVEIEKYSLLTSFFMIALYYIYLPLPVRVKHFLLLRKEKKKYLLLTYLKIPLKGKSSFSLGNILAVKTLTCFVPLKYEKVAGTEMRQPQNVSRGEESDPHSGHNYAVCGWGV